MQKSRHKISSFFGKKTLHLMKISYFCQNAEMQNFLHLIKIFKTCINAEMQMKINQIFSEKIDFSHKKGVITWKNIPENLISVQKSLKKLQHAELKNFLHFTRISDRCKNAEKQKILHFGKILNACRIAEMQKWTPPPGLHRLGSRFRPFTLFRFSTKI